MSQQITITNLNKDDKIPDKLLLLADPSKDLVDEYLKQSEIFTARKNDETPGVVVLFPLTTETVEIKNIAVKPAFKGQGIGSYLIENVIQIASHNTQKSNCIGTANSSVGQLYLYQKPGFEITEITEIKKDYFTKYDADPMHELCIQAKHKLMLTRQLKAE